MNAINPWVVLVFAIVGELVGTMSLKYADGWGRPWAWVGVATGYGTALILLATVIQRIDISVVYAIWSGVGITLVAIIGVVAFGETITWIRALGLAATTLGVVLLHASSR